MTVTEPEERTEPTAGRASAGRESDWDDRDDWDDWDDPDDIRVDAPPDEPGTVPDAACPPVAPPRHCRNCEHPVPSSAVECPNCLTPLAHLVLVLHTTPALSVTASPGRPLRLGRDPEWAPRTAPALGRWPGVSRRHATITVERDGTAWLTDGGTDDGTTASLNGTWVNGRRLDPPAGGDAPDGARHRLRDGDELGLGRRVRGTVRLDGPDPSPDDRPPHGA